MQYCSAQLKKVFKNISLLTLKTEETPAKPRTFALKINSLCSILQTISNQVNTIRQTAPVRSDCSGPIQLNFKHLQGQKLYSLSRQPLSVLKHPYGDLFPWPLSWHSASLKKLWLHLLCTLLLGIESQKQDFSSTFPSCGWTNPALSCISCAKLPDQFSGVHHTHSNMSICLFCGAQNWSQHSDVVSQIEGMNHFCCYLTSNFHF